MERNPTSERSDLTICADNVSALDKRQADEFECRVALLRELSRAAIDEVAVEMPLIDRLREAYELSQVSRHKDDLGEYFSADTVASFFDSISVSEKLEICRTLRKEIKDTRDALKLLIEVSGPSQSELRDENSSGRIAYMKNNYTESAFLKFSKVLSSARSAYFQSFDAVCEEVYSGRCEFCILPLESSSEGQLNSFYSMIDRFELKIAAVCDVEHHDSQRFTRFALLKKSLFETVGLRHQPKEQILEFRFSSAIGGTSPLCDILTAAEACRLRLLRLASLPLPYNDEMLSYYASFTVDGAELLTFLTFIALEFPQCDPLGVYFKVK